MYRQYFGRHVAVALLASVLIACGDGESGGGSPTTPSGQNPGTSGATITIDANGAVSPSQVTINVGQSVTFVNNHSRAHEISSDPHPTHTNCPSINALGGLAAGQTRMTNAFAAAATCGFHDHLEPDNAALRGTITVR